MDGEAKLGPNQENFEFSLQKLEQWKEQDKNKVRPHLRNSDLPVSIELLLLRHMSSVLSHPYDC